MAEQAGPSDGEPIRSFRDLRVWQQALELIVETETIAGAIPRNRSHGRRGQLIRSAQSVADNIAEGHGREHLGDYLHHLSIAYGSLMEVRSQLLILARLRLVTADAIGPVEHRIDEMARMMNALVRSLRRRADDQ